MQCVDSGTAAQAAPAFGALVYVPSAQRHISAEAEAQKNTNWIEKSSSARIASEIGCMFDVPKSKELFLECCGQS